MGAIRLNLEKIHETFCPQSSTNQYETSFANEVHTTTLTNIIKTHNKTLSPIKIITALKHELHRPTEKVVDIMYVYSYIPMINRPTRVTRDTCTLIDNIFTSNYSISSNFVSGILKADITDHYILFHIIKDKDDKKDDSNEYKTVRIVNESRTNQFIEKIQNANWSVLNSYRDCQTYFSKFYALFKTIYDGSFPLTTVEMRYRNRLPWLTDGLKKSIKYKNKLYRISIKHPTSYNISKYKNFKNKLSSILRKEE